MDAAHQKHVPVWFKERLDKKNKQVEYEFKGGYWESRKTGIY